MADHHVAGITLHLDCLFFETTFIDMHPLSLAARHARVYGPIGISDIKAAGRATGHQDFCTHGGQFAVISKQTLGDCQQSRMSGKLSKLDTPGDQIGEINIPGEFSAPSWR